MSDFKITSAAEYKEKFATKSKLVQLPSGAVFRLRSLKGLDFIANVIIPVNLLDEKDLKQIDDLKTEEDKQQYMSGKLTPEKAEQLSIQLLISSVTEPKLVQSETPGENEVSLSSLNALDKVFLYKEIQQLNALDKISREGILPFRTE